ncbi:hypothetical protein [Trinickia violacea]|uniref:hypothetical protein n=1 Tax=Trinickia violacea TaxID=2571746 RepID=UPI001586A3E1|nr:hypothetical protein [Trinickia violacea]
MAPNHFSICVRREWPSCFISVSFDSRMLCRIPLEALINRGFGHIDAIAVPVIKQACACFIFESFMSASAWAATC